jgi:hypothetical protein
MAGAFHCFSCKKPISKKNPAISFLVNNKKVYEHCACFLKDRKKEKEEK